MKHEKKHPNEEMQEEHAKVDVPNDPSITAVSDVAKGQPAQTETDRRADYFEEWSEKAAGEAGDKKPELPEDATCDDLEQAYAMLFGGMSMMMKSLSAKK